MIGTLAQIITLTAYGNDYLRNGSIPVDFDHHAVFQFCNKVDFSEFGNVHPSSALGEKMVSVSPAGWFRHLKTDGCKHLRLYYEGSKDQDFAKDHKLAGFIGGGGDWFIEAVYDSYSIYWANRWMVTDKNAADRRIWTVNYGALSARHPTNDLQIDNQTVKNELRRVLSEIADFASEQDLQSWAEQFDRSMTVLDSSSPEEDFQPRDLIPLENYSLTAKQIIFSAGSAWVFGGMGSWNDLGFDDEADNEKYDDLSEQLYSKINEAIIAGINTY
ncbi:MAG: hypothetical protein FWC29_04325 [Methanomassiliicoccaceae archaeon]|nr:hypothetical protein [Methanomassiliicoccaceae archaeon]